MTFEIVQSNLAEAREELTKLEAAAAAGTLKEVDFQIRLAHAYHHLNFAWNIRHVAASTYAKLTQEQFEEWGRYPAEIEQLP
jgi:hypothetical protein